MVYSRRKFLQTMAAGSAAAVLPGALLWGQNAGSTVPNILLIMADDMGYGDPQCYNPASKIPTPNIDRLASQGKRFTDAHAPGAVCIPSRYGLLTGRYPYRTPMNWRERALIDENRVTLGSLLQDQGYYTTMVGKWHQGFHTPKADRDHRQPLRGGPVDRGFDQYFGIPASLDQPPYYYIRNDKAVKPPTGEVEDNFTEGWSPIQGAFYRGGGIAPGFEHREVLPRFAQEAETFLQTHHQKRENQPFFLYLALAAPHTPWMPDEAYDGVSEASLYGDFAAHVDGAIGRVLDTLDSLGLRENTLVIFTSDNGPVWYDHDVNRFQHDSAGPLRGMKGDIWEAGHRMPFIVRWPGKVEPSSVSEETICFTDLLATFAAVTDTVLPEDAGEDSYNLLPVLLDQEYESPLREATVFTSAGDFYAIRQGKWKLIPRRGSGGFTDPQEKVPGWGGTEGQLYDLENDLDESNNLYDQYPEVVERLSNLLEQYKTSARTAPMMK